MVNKVGRDIPDALLKNGYEVYQGNDYRDQKTYRTAGARVRPQVTPRDSKLMPSLREAIEACHLKDGATVSFHHHFRDGDYIVNMVMQELVAMGLKDITIAASSLGGAHDPVADYIERGIVTGIQTSGIRGRIGDVVSRGLLKTPAILRSHGGRVRAIEAGEVHIDAAFIGAPTSDVCGNASAKGGKSDCGVLSYAMADAKFADHVVVITDTLVPYPNMPCSIQGVDVDYVVAVDAIGNPAKIASAAARITRDPRDLMMAEMTAKVIAATPYFRDGFSFQTGVGGPSIAATMFLKDIMKEKGYRMSWAVGGIAAPMVDLLNEGMIGTIVDTQDFDLAAVRSVGSHPRHFEISASQYANPMNKGAFINKLDFVILAALEIDTHFNVNVVTGSDGVLRGAPGGHPDTSASAKCSIIVTPLVRGRMATVCENVITVTTPGETVDILVTDYGVAVNPLRQDLQAALSEAGVETTTIEDLKNLAYAMVGVPDPIPFEDQVVAIMEARDGTILDVVRKVKESV